MKEIANNKLKVHQTLFIIFGSFLPCIISGRVNILPYILCLVLIILKTFGIKKLNVFIFIFPILAWFLFHHLSYVLTPNWQLKVLVLITVFYLAHHTYQNISRTNFVFAILSFLFFAFLIVSMVFASKAINYQNNFVISFNILDYLFLILVPADFDTTRKKSYIVGSSLMLFLIFIASFFLAAISINGNNIFQGIAKVSSPLAYFITRLDTFAICFYAAMLVNQLALLINGIKNLFPRFKIIVIAGLFIILLIF